MHHEAGSSATMINTSTMREGRAMHLIPDPFDTGRYVRDTAPVRTACDRTIQPGTVWGPEVWAKNLDLARTHQTGHCARCITATRTRVTTADPAPICEWFARCGQPATGTTDHPILGAVPTCDRCAAFAEPVASVASDPVTVDCDRCGNEVNGYEHIPSEHAPSCS